MDLRGKHLRAISDGFVLFLFHLLTGQLGFSLFVFVVMGGCYAVFCFTESYIVQVGLGLSHHPVIRWVYHHDQPLKLLFF